MAIKFLRLIILLLLFIPSAYAQKSKSNNIGKIIDAYLGVKNALVNDDGATAKFKANDLFQLFAGSPDKGLNHDQSKLIADYLQPILENTRYIAETSTESEQRSYLSSLSRAMYGLLKGLKINTSTLYEQYCPLNKSYWLSETKEIKNPYYNYGEKDMITCGKTISVLAAVN